MDDGLWTFAEVAAYLGHVSRSTVYRLVDEGHIVRVHVGGSARIVGQSVRDYVGRLEAAETPARGVAVAMPPEAS